MKIAEEFIEKRNKIPYPTEDKTYLQQIIVLKKQIEDITAIHKAKWFAKRQSYRDEIYKLDQEFKLALFEYYGVTTNPKREEVFTKAWEQGHSSGYNEVEIYFSELVDLIK